MMEMEQKLSVDMKKGLWESPVPVSQRTGRKRTGLREGRRNPLSGKCHKSRLCQLGLMKHPHASQNYSQYTCKVITRMND